MRIHRLHIEAIGPFPGSHDVDFDELSAGGLFLLEGPTGAGKSTLIDAITFGLYGTVGTLGTAENTRLPSNHAPLSEPVIEVTFSTTSGIYRTRRTPAWERPKKRGDGLTSQNATAKLWRLSAVEDVGGEPIAATTQEVGAEMQRILGLTREQFMQTVVLPQGRFSTFLRARPDERAQVLRDVFGTAIYQQVQDQLIEMARTAKRRITAAEGETSSAVAAFTSLLSDVDPAIPALHEAGSALDADELIRIADEVWTATKQRCEEAGEALGWAQTAEVTARLLLDSQKELQNNLARRTALLTEQTRLTDQTDSIARSRERLATGQRAAMVTGSLRAHESATSSMSRAHQRVATSCGELRGTPDADLSEIGHTEAVRDVIEDVTSKRSGLVEGMQVEATLPERLERLTSDEASLTEASAALTMERQELSARPTVREQLAASLDALRQTATPVALAEQIAQRRITVRDAAKRVEIHTEELGEAQQRLAAAARTATAATEEESAVRLRWIRSTAGTLAAELGAGLPCPVCGGTEHPHPAPELPDHATSQDVDEATQRRQLADAALQRADSALIRIAEKLEAQQEAAAHTSLIDAETALAAAEADVADAKKAVRLIETAEKAIIHFDTETDAIKKRIAAAETATATTTERLRRDRELLEADQQRCRAAAGDCASVAAHVDRLDARLARARKLVDALQGFHEAEQRVNDTSTTLGESLREAGFEDADAVRAAQLATAESADLQQRLQKYDADLARVTSGLAEESMAALTGDEVVDVSAARTSHTLSHEALMAASAAGATATAAAQQCDRSRRSLVKVLDKHRKLVDDAAPVLRMMELATGGEGNLRSTTLSTFVLLRRFEDVVAAANDRLAVVSGGRFMLLRTDEREGRARKAGLGLSVRDHHTEINRDPHTLSGGETFYVSLCLALGLADVVTSEAGGISLDTLFIDEGFGSLDSDTLDGVLGELSRLQAGGRAVGIVSHVAELKTRIPQRVEISRRAAGGSTLSVRA